MSSFADFALLASIPSYGGAEILRAQRILPSGAGPRVHLALFGRSNEVARRVVDVARAAAKAEHPALARILEVGRYDGIVFGVADPAEGVDVASLLVSDRTRKRAPAHELAVGITLAVARVVVALHETGDAWADAEEQGLAGIFPAGVGPDALFLEPGGAVRLRVLAAAATDPRAPSFFRAPDQNPSQASDVFSLGRLLFALLAGDPTGQETPRLPAGSPLARTLPRLIDPRPEDRLDLHDLIERLEVALNDAGTTPEAAVTEALAGPYRNMVVDAGAGFVPADRVIDEIRSRLGGIYDSVVRLFPVASPPLPPVLAALPAHPASDDDVPVFTDARPAVRPPRARTANTLLIDDVNAARAPAPPRAAPGRTSPTLLITDAAKLAAAAAALSAASVEAAADDEDAFDRPSERTELFDPASPPAGLARPPVLPGGPVAPPPPPPGLQRPPVLPPTPTKAPPPSPDDLPRQQTDSGGVFANTGVDHDDESDIDIDLGLDDGDDGDDSGDARPGEQTVVARPPPASTPPDRARTRPAAAANTAFANASTRLPESPAGAPPPAMSAEGFPPENPGDTAITSNVPDLSQHSVDGSGVFQGDDDPELIEDGADFQMVGDAGRTFDETNNPFRGSTRMIPAQALQAPRPSSEESAPVVDDADADAGPTEMFSAARMLEMLGATGGDAATSPPTMVSPAPISMPPAAAVAPSPVPSPLPAPVPAPATSHVLIIEAPDDASVFFNGAVVGTGKVSLDVDASTRAVVKVTSPGFTPWSSVVQMQGRPRVRVRPKLVPKK